MALIIKRGISGQINSRLVKQPRMWIDTFSEIERDPQLEILISNHYMRIVTKKYASQLISERSTVPVSSSIAKTGRLSDDLICDILSGSAVFVTMSTIAEKEINRLRGLSLMIGADKRGHQVVRKFPIKEKSPYRAKLFPL